jgi:hypothetical protein
MAAAKKVVTKKASPPVKSKTVNDKQSTTLFDRVESWMAGNEKLLCLLIAIFSSIFAILLFDVKISEANDDSLYIEGAFNFAKSIHNEFTANAPLYPLLLSIPVRFFGINLIVLKSFSLILFVLQQVILFLALRKRMPYLVFVPVLFIISINSFFLYFASQTFTECLFLVVQALLLYSVFNLPNQVDKINPKSFLPFLYCGAMLVIIGLCKNIAIASVVAVLLFLLLQRKFKHIAALFLGYAVVKIPLEIIKSFIWPGLSQFSSQSDILRQKDPYNPAKGYEDISGFISRFTDNIGLYIGKRFYQIIGFISEDDQLVRPGLIFLFFLVLIPAIVYAIKNKNKTIQFVFIYVLGMTSLTFIVLQKSWDQPRMVMVYSGLMLILIFYGFYEWLKKTVGFFQLFYFFLVLILFFSSFIPTITKSTQNYHTLRKNFGGDIYYGYTPDWTNFLKMSKYCGDSLTPTAFVASRKAPMSFVYSNGHKFFPIYTVVSSDADSVIAYCKENKVTHVMIGSLRRNPKKNDGYVINTMQRMFMPVAQKYPQRLVLVKQIGESEPAYLYEIRD